MIGMKSLRFLAFLSQLPRKSIRMRIWLSVLLCVVSVGVVAAANYKIMSDTAALPRQIYDEPYRVGLAVRDLRADVAVMHAELTDLARAPSKLGLRRFQKRMVEIDDHVGSLRQAIASRFRGDAALVESAFSGLDAWNAVRQQVVAAIKSKDQVSAYTLTKTEGYNQVKVIEESLQHLVDAANRQSKSLYSDASAYLYLSRFQSAGSVLVALIFLGGAAFMINSILVRPVLDISDAMSSIAQGNLSTRIPHGQRPDEIGRIARSSKVFLNHAIAIQDETKKN
ncbi:MAG: MCP four helix bundle domain-containing protein [Pseudomonadota bacterium]